MNLIHDIAVPEGLTVYFCIRLRKQNEKMKMKAIKTPELT